MEGEIGHVGVTETGDNELSDLYTTVEEAVGFVKETGVDALKNGVGAYFDIGDMKFQAMKQAAVEKIMLFGANGRG